MNSKTIISSAFFCSLMLSACSSPKPSNNGSTFEDASSLASDATSDSSGQNGVDAEVIDFDASFSVDGAGDGFAACATTKAEAKRTPLHFVVLLDRSGSMCFTGNTAVGDWNNNCQDAQNRSRWQQSTAALKAFFENQTNAGSYASLFLFPKDNTQNYCSTATTPVQSDLLLPDTAHVLATKMAANVAVPLANTPTDQAIQNTLTYIQSLPVLTDGGKYVLLLVTDGKPQDCNNTNSEPLCASKLAAAKAQIPSYVIGITGGDSALETGLSTIAGGSSGPAIFIQDITQVQAQLGAALEQIRGQVISCDYPIPPNSDIDFAKVNVDFYSDPNAAATPLYKSQDCTDALGWKYDNNTAPTKITLCPGACTQAKQALDSKVDVLFGCQSRER